jgi:hypothetical protein
MLRRLQSVIPVRRSSQEVGRLQPVSDPRESRKRGSLPGEGEASHHVLVDLLMSVRIGVLLAIRIEGQEVSPVFRHGDELTVYQVVREAGPALRR